MGVLNSSSIYQIRNSALGEIWGEISNNFMMDMILVTLPKAEGFFKVLNNGVWETGKTYYSLHHSNIYIYVYIYIYYCDYIKVDYRKSKTCLLCVLFCGMS